MVDEAAHDADVEGSPNIAAPSTNSVSSTLVRLGFRAGSGGAHSARTMMFADLERVLDHLGHEPARVAEVRRAIVDENLLGRATAYARREAAKRLTELYGLDDRFALFRALRRLWGVDEAARPALALLVAMARDAILRGAMPFVESLAPGEPFVVAELVDFLRRRGRQRFSESSLRSMARNVASSWTQSGMLKGAVRKQRVRLEPRPASVALAMFLGHLEGARGIALLSTPWTRVFDGGAEAVRRCGSDANRQSLLRMAAIDDVVTVSFAGWLDVAEQEALDEQNRSAA